MTPIEKRLLALCTFQTIALAVAMWLGFESCLVIRKTVQTNGEQRELIHLQEQKIELLEHKFSIRSR